MYLYEISWSWNEDYNPIFLINEKFLDYKEFKQIVDEETKAAFEKLFNEENEKDSEERNYIGFCRWNELSETIFGYLQRYGFERLSVNTKLDNFGMYVADSGLPPEEADRFKEICGEELIEKIIKHNNGVNDRVSSIGLGIGLGIGLVGNDE